MTEDNKEETVKAEEMEEKIEAENENANEVSDTDGAEVIEKDLSEQKELAEEYFNRLQRLQADFENYKRRVRTEKEEFYKYASENLMLQLLPVMDNFERAMASASEDNQGLMSGVQLIYRQLKEVLEREGLKCIDTVGCEFNPNFHEAVMQVDSDEQPSNHCVEELQKGYQLKEKIIRPAMVKVAK